MSELAMLSLSEASAGLAARRFAPSELLESCLERIEGVGAALNAFITLLADPAREAARAADERIAGGRRLGDLDGIPVVLKDNIDVAGVATTAGLAFRRARRAERDAFCVDRLRRAGAIILGKTNLHEGALGATTDNPFYGRTFNPHGENLTPGGSSGGSAAAVAARLCPGALGTDTMGSVRIPAAYCGVVGLKPTFGLVSTKGVCPLSWRLDHVGPLTRSVADAAILLDGVAGFDPDCPDSRRPPVQTRYAAPAAPEVKGWRLGLLTNFEQVEWAPGVRQAFDAALAVMRDLGCEVRSVEIPGYHPSRARRAGLLIVEADAAVAHGADLDRHSEGFSPEVRAMLEFGRTCPAARLAEAERVVALAARGVARLFDSLEAIVSPTAPQPAFSFAAPIPDSQADLTALANFADCPALSIPMGSDPAGLPLGLQFMAPAWREDRVLALAAAYEAAAKMVPLVPRALA